MQTENVNGSQKIPSGRPLWVIVLAGLLGTGLVILVAFYFTAVLATGEWSGWALRPVDYLNLVRTAVTFAGAIAIGATLLLAYRRQLTNDAVRRITADNLEHDRAKEASRQDELLRQSAVDAERELRARFSSATVQLGHNQSVSRIAAVYAIASLADDWHAFGNDDERQVCIDVLCGYFRLPVEASTARSEEDVRQAVLRVVRNHLRPRVPEGADWGTANFDFSGAQFRGGSLADIVTVSGRWSFDNATFAKTFSFRSINIGRSTHWGFSGVRFQADVDFSFSEFKNEPEFSYIHVYESGSLTLTLCTFQGGANFAGAAISGSELDLSYADVWTILDLSEVTVSAGTLQMNATTLRPGSSVGAFGIEITGGHIDLAGADFSSATLYSDDPALFSEANPGTVVTEMSAWDERKFAF